MQTDDLPETMLAPLLELARVLLEHARRHRDQPLARHEQAVLDAWRAAAPQVLAATVQQATTGLDATQRPIAATCAGCAQRRPVQSRRTRQVQTRLGPVTFERPWHHCVACGRGWSPSDQVLRLQPGQRTSAGLAAWAARVGALTTFREAATLLADLAGVDLGAETVRTHAERIGTGIELAQRATTVYVQHQHEPPPRQRRARTRHPAGRGRWRHGALSRQGA